MEELQKLRTFVEKGKYADALEIIDELEEMSVEDKLNRISSHCVILLLHLIKQKVEQRTTKLWDASIANAVFEINKTNRRRRSKGSYATDKILLEIVEEAMPVAITKAAADIAEGTMEMSDIIRVIKKDLLKKEVLGLLKGKHNKMAESFMNRGAKKE